MYESVHPHHLANLAASAASKATAPPATWKGRARRISRCTPEGDVNGVEPVKFIAT